MSPNIYTIYEVINYLKGNKNGDSPFSFSVNHKFSKLIFQDFSVTSFYGNVQHAIRGEFIFKRTALEGQGEDGGNSWEN